MSYNALYDDKFELEPNSVKKTRSKSAKKAIETELEPNSKKLEPNKKQTISDLKVLDFDSLWGEFCRLSNDPKIQGIFLWLAKTDAKTVPKLDPVISKFYRSNAVSGLIKLFRELKKEGYV